MKKIKLVLIAIPLLFCGFSAAAFDYGVEIANTTGTRTSDEFGFFYDHKATLWFSVPFNNAKTTFLAVEGSIFASRPILADEYTVVANLDLLRLSHRLVKDESKTLSIDIGRIPVADVAGLYLNTKADGAEFHGVYGFANIDILAAYTGLLNVRSGSVLMSSDDRAETITEELYAFGSPRFIGKFTLQIPQVLSSMDIVTEVAGQYDLRPLVKSEYAQSIHTIFLTLSANGPVPRVPNLFYTVTGVLENGILEESGTSYSVVSGVTSARLDLYPVASNHLYTEVLFSPANDEIVTEFIPITFQSAGALYGRGYENLIRISAGWNINPIKAFNLSAGAKLFMHQEELFIDAGLYDSTEISVGATIEATSELRFNLSTDLLFPKEEDMQYLVSLKAVFNL